MSVIKIWLSEYLAMIQWEASCEIDIQKLI